MRSSLIICPIERTLTDPTTFFPLNIKKWSHVSSCSSNNSDSDIPSSLLKTDLRIFWICEKSSSLKFNCNILNGSFYLDSHNYFPITEELNTFLDVYSWGDLTKYNNFYSKSFINNFKQNKPQFQIIKNVFVLGSSSQNNYYRNIITFLPRLFYNNDKRIYYLHEEFIFKY